jgi:hypothetical protein
MKLNQIAAKPKLITITLDDEEIVKEFGEPVEFHTWDRQPLEVFMKLASANQQDQSQMIDIVRTLILDENGKQIIDGENMLPTNMLVKAIAKIVEKLGK